MHGITSNALKSSHFSHSKWNKNNAYEWNYLKLSTHIFSGRNKMLKLN